MAFLSQLTEPLNWGDHDAGGHWRDIIKSRSQRRGRGSEREEGRERERRGEHKTQEGGSKEKEERNPRNEIRIGNDCAEEMEEEEEEEEEAAAAS